MSVCNVTFSRFYAHRCFSNASFRFLIVTLPRCEDGWMFGMAGCMESMEWMEGMDGQMGCMEYMNGWKRKNGWTGGMDGGMDVMDVMDGGIQVT